MKRLITINCIFTACLFLLACGQPYQIILGETHFTTHAGTGERQHSLIEGLLTQTQFTVNGVYWQKQIGKHQLPAILHFNQTHGIGYVVLAESLSVEKGSWIRVEGMISTRSLDFGVAGASVAFKVLEVDGVEIMGSTKPFVALAQQEYEEIRESIETSITPAESKLALPKHPDWMALIDKELGHVIVSMRINDLMYAGEVDFVFDLKKSKLLSVYANEWFKGE